MTSLARIRPSLRRAAFVAALGALMVPATAGASVHAHAAAKRRVKPPVVTNVSPLRLEIGQTLEIRGRYFRRGRNKNTVVFKRSGGRAVFVKAAVGTAKLLRVTVPAKLQKELVTSGTTAMPTLFRVRVLAKKFGKGFTKASLSPVVAPRSVSAVTGADGAPSLEAVPDGDCNGDGIKNRDSSDDDGDLMPDTLETQIGTDPCKMDTDGDGVEDGYEYRSAIDLNNDEYQDPNASMPYPGKRPYPNPLYNGDAATDFDGDGLELGEEQRLWKYSYNRPGKVRSLDSLYYSDGMKYSIYTLVDGDRRKPALPAAGYEKQVDFENWLNAAHYATVYLPDADNRYSLLDANRDGVVSETAQPGYKHSERYYLDRDRNSYLSDDERDEDADGLSNFTESHGEMANRKWWDGVYDKEGPFHLDYAGTDLADADSDGDGVRDGADDQDHDDIPNLMELSRNMVSGRDFGSVSPEPWYGRVNPFNPCLPDIHSRTCPTYVPLGGGAWAPFDGPPYDSEGSDVNYIVLN
jgi:hypothetical protein